MYTFYKDHLTWQQAVNHETKQLQRHNSKYEDVIFDYDNQTKYLTKIEEYKMKRFLGQHLSRYMPNVETEIKEEVKSIKGKFAPLQQMRFVSTPRA